MDTEDSKLGSDDNLPTNHPNPKVDMGHSIRGPGRLAAAHNRAPVLLKEKRRERSKLGGVIRTKNLQA